MSRIGKQPVVIPAGVKVAVADQQITVEGPLGRLDWQFRPELKVDVEGNQVKIARTSETRLARSLHGLSRALIQNMVEGVTKG